MCWFGIIKNIFDIIASLATMVGILITACQFRRAYGVKIKLKYVIGCIGDKKMIKLLQCEKNVPTCRFGIHALALNYSSFKYVVDQLCLVVREWTPIKTKVKTCVEENFAKQITHIMADEIPISLKIYKLKKVFKELFKMHETMMINMPQSECKALTHVVIEARSTYDAAFELNEGIFRYILSKGFTNRSKIYIYTHAFYKEKRKRIPGNLGNIRTEYEKYLKKNRDFDIYSNYDTYERLYKKYYKSKNGDFE